MKTMVRGVSLFALLGAVLPAAPAQGRTVPAPPVARPEYRLLVDVAVLRDGGLLVSSVAPASPARRMVAAGNPNLYGSLEPGDVITHANGWRIRCLADLRAHLALGASVTLTVRDVRTGWLVNWRVTPARVVLTP
jgi:S1-C subfamily serine protease